MIRGRKILAVGSRSRKIIAVVITVGKFLWWELE